MSDQRDLGVQFVTGHTVRSSRVHAKTCILSTFFKKFRKPEIRRKKYGPYFILASFKGSKRQAVYLDRYFGAVLDLDDTTLSLQDIRDRLPELTYLIHTTHSHDPRADDNRYRVIIPYSKPVRPDRHLKNMAHLISQVNAGTDKGVDLSSSAMARPMFFPACPPEREEHFVFKKYRGELYNPVNHPIQIAYPPPGSVAAWIKSEESKPAEPDRFDDTRKVSTGERNSTMAQYVGKLFGEGKLDRDGVEIAAETHNATKCNPRLSKKELNGIINSVYKTHERSGQGWGFNELMYRIESTPLNEAGRLSVESVKGLLHAVAQSHENLDPLQQGEVIDALGQRSSSNCRTLKAQMHACRKALREEATTALDDDDEEGKEKFPEMPTMGEIRELYQDLVFRRHVGDWWSVKSCRPYGSRATLNETMPLFMKKKAMPDTTKFLLQQGLVDIVYTDMYVPLSDKRIIEYNGEQYINSYQAKPLKPKPSANGVRKLIKHLSYLFDTKDRRIFTQFVAYLIQHPGKKILWLPIIIGPPGVGKSLLYTEIILPLLGESNCKTVVNQSVFSQFNDWAHGVQIACFQEFSSGNDVKQRAKFTESLKSIITERQISLHRKHEGQRMVENTTNFLAFTNDPTPIQIEAKDRRFCFLNIESERETTRYYKNLIDWFRENRRQMLHYFEGIDLQEFEPHTCPQTNHTKIMKVMSQDIWPRNVFIGDFLLGEESHFSELEVITWEGILDFLKAQSSGEDLDTLSGISAINSSFAEPIRSTLTNLGFKRATNPRKVRGRRTYIFSVPEVLSRGGVGASRPMPQRARMLQLIRRAENKNKYRY